MKTYLPIIERCPGWHIDIVNGEYFRVMYKEDTSTLSEITYGHRGWESNIPTDQVFHGTMHDSRIEAEQRVLEYLRTHPHPSVSQGPLS